MQTRTDEIQKLLRQARIYNYLNKPWHYIHLRLLNNNSAAPLWSECCMLMMRLKRSHVFVKCSKMEQPFHVQSCWHWWDENFIEDIPIKLQLFMKHWRPSGVCNSSSRRLNQQIILAYRTLYIERGRHGRDSTRIYHHQLDKFILNMYLILQIGVADKIQIKTSLVSTLKHFFISTTHIYLFFHSAYNMQSVIF